MLLVAAGHAAAADEQRPGHAGVRRLLLPHADGGRHGHLEDEHDVRGVRGCVDHAVRLRHRGGGDHAGDDGPGHAGAVHVRPGRGAGARAVRPGEPAAQRGDRSRRGCATVCVFVGLSVGFAVVGGGGSGLKLLCLD